MFAIGLGELLIIAAILLLPCAGVVGIVLLVRGTAQPSKMGFYLNPPEACPRCGVALPAMRAPKNLRQMLWGGWTCTGCGIELDKWGQPVPK